MSGGLKEQWGVGDAAQAGPDAQSQDLKTAFEKAMDTMAEHLQYTAVNADQARQDPLASRCHGLVPRYQDALKQVDAADPAKAKPGIDSLLADATALDKDVAAFRAEIEKAVNEWHSRSGAYDGAVKQVEEISQWQHPKEADVRALADAIRGSVNDRAYDKAVSTHDQFLPKLQPVYEDLQKQKAAQQQYEPAVASLEPKLAEAAVPSFKKMAAKQAELASSKSAMESSAQGKDFVAAVAASASLSERVGNYSEEVKQIQQAKDQYEQAYSGIQSKLQAAPNPSPFKKLEAMQAELSNGQKEMESSATSEEFEQALQKANDLGGKADAYSEQVKQIQQAKDQYEQVLGGIQTKVQAAPSPSPFKKLEAMQAELSNGQKDMESSAQSEEFEQALQKANDLGGKADAYSEQVKQIQQAKDQYEQVLGGIQTKVQAAPSPSPFKKLEAMQAELSNGQKDMESSAQSEEFEQALQKANDLGGKADAYSEQVKQIQQAKDQYEQVLGGIQTKVQAAPSPSPFKKLEAMQAELSNGQKDMESSAQSEEFEQALQKANDLGGKADAYSEQVKQIQQAKDQYEQVLGGIQTKVQAAPSPSPFKKLEAMQAELSNGQKEMESSATSEEFEQALQKANDLGGKADAYSEQVKQIQQAKDQYEQVLGGIQTKVQAAPSPSPFKKLEAMQAELSNGQKDMESSAQSEEFEQALQKANDLGGKADAYSEQVKQIQQAKDQYEQVLGGIQTKVQAAPSPSPFKKLEAMQAELSNGQKDMESSAQSEEFEQALQKANDLGGKADAYSEQVKQIQQAKDQYEQVFGGVQTKLQSAPSPSPFKKLEAMQAELSNGQKDMESSAQSEEFEQALQKANDLGGKADAYSEQVKQIQQAKDQYEQVLGGIQTKVQAAPSPSPFKKLEAMQAELSNGQKEMESSAQSEEFEQALAKANELGGKADAYSEEVKRLQQAKTAYEQAWAQAEAKVEAARAPSPFVKTLGQRQTELAELQGQMGLDVADEKFEEALEKVGKLSSEAEAITTTEAEMQRQKAAYEQAWAQAEAKVEAARAPSTFVKTLGQRQTELAELQGQMGLDVADEKFGEALEKVGKLSSEADAITAADADMKRQKAAYEQAWAQSKPKVEAAPRPSPFVKLAPLQEALIEGQGQMGFDVDDEKFDQALQKATELGSKAEAYAEQVKQSQEAKDAYQLKLGDVQTKLSSLSAVAAPQLGAQQAELAPAQKAMESSAQAEDFPAALQQANELLAKLDAFAAALAALEAKKKEYEERLVVLKPALAKALDAQGGKPTALQEELAALSTQMEAAAQGGDASQALKLADDISKKLDALGKQSAPAASPDAKSKDAGSPAAGAAPTEAAPATGGDSIKVAGTFDVGPVDWEFGKWGSDSNFTGSFKVKGKGKVELVTKTTGKKASIGSSTDGGHKSEVELGVQKAKELTDQGWKDVFSTLRIKEIKESFKDEVTNKKIEIAVDVKVTFESRLPWLSPVASGKFVIAGAEWEKIKKDPFAFTVGGLEASGGVEAKGPLPLDFDMFDASIASEITVGGSVKLNWPVIMRKMLQKYGEQALQKVAEQGAKIVAEEGAKQGAKAVVEQGAKEAAKQGAKEAAKQGAKEVAKDAALAATEGAGEAALVMDSAALASAAAAVLLPAAAVAVMIAGVCQEVANMRADSEAIATALPARKRAATAAAAYADTMTGGHGKGEGGQYAEAQIDDMMSKTNATREQVIEAVTRAQGSFTAIRERELKRLKDKMYDAACQAFDKGHEPFSFPESRGADWGYRASFRKMLSLILYADD